LRGTLIRLSVPDNLEKNGAGKELGTKFVLLLRGQLFAGGAIVDGTRSRRTRDSARQRWYARWRATRFARHLGFRAAAALSRLFNRELTPPARAS
jgi:hypothetical protein